MNIDEAIEALAGIGGDSAPTTEQITEARNILATELIRLRETGEAAAAISDPERREALEALRGAYDAAGTELAARAEAEAELAAEVDGLLDGVAGADTVDTGGVVVPEAVAASMSVTEAARRLGVRARDIAPSAPIVDMAASTSTLLVDGKETTTEATFAELGEIFARAARGGRQVNATVREVFATERTLTGDQSHNQRIIESLFSPQALSAAGGCCGLPTVVRDNPVTASTAEPIRDGIGGELSAQGPVQALGAICIPDVDVWTCADDAAVTSDPETWKQCADIACPTVETFEPFGVPYCANIGNFNARMNPEQWAGVLQAGVAGAARAAEIELFNRIVAGATSAHVGTAHGSQYTNVVRALVRAATLIRQDTRTESRLVAVLPEWVSSAIIEDSVSRRVADVEAPLLGKQAVAEALNGLNVDLIWSPDIDDIEAFQYDGAMAAYPEVGNFVMFAEGDVIPLDFGGIDLGTEIRDQSMNRQNKQGLFIEPFKGVMVRGCNIKAGTIPTQILATACAC